MNVADLKRQPMSALFELARELEVEGAGSMRRADLVLALLRAGAARGVPLFARGVLEVHPEGFGFLRSPDQGLSRGRDDVYVLPSMIKKLGLRAGDDVAGALRPPRENEAYFTLTRVDAVGGAPLARDAERPSFDALPAATPSEWLRLEHDPKALTSRFIDLMAPLARGQRALFVAPARAPRVVVHRELAMGLAQHADVRVVVVLLDARPEDVSELRRSAGCTVIGTGFGDAAAAHVRAVDLALESAKRVAEAGGHVVLLLDSLGRYARAVHAVLTGAPPGKGAPLDAAALERAATLFSSAKAIAGAGSLTLLATWVTEGRDDAFLGTLREASDAELHVDKALVDARLVPALSLPHTASKHTHADAFVALRAELLRKLLEPMQVLEAATLIAERMQRSPSNHALLEGMNQ